jgi:hypothetical protein
VLTVLVQVVAYVYRDALEEALAGLLPQVDWHHMHLQATAADAVLVLSLLLGAFPVVTRPLRPLKPLKATSNARKPARLSLVVPKLPKRRPSRAETGQREA